MDEYDYLFVGKTLLSGGHWPTHTYIFGWDLNWILLAWGDKVLGGLHGARWVAAIIGAISLISMYTFVFVLWRNPSTALIAALLLGLEGAHLFTSALATYDIISFTAFFCALPCVLLACQPERKQLMWTLSACLALSVAVLSKYTVVIYLPLILILVLRYSPRHAIIGILLITTVLSTYIAMNFDQLKILYEVQIQRTHGTNSIPADIFNRAVRQLWVVLLLAGLGISYAVLTRCRELKIILILVVFSLPLFVYHLYSQNVISLQKHLVFSSLFLIPIIAWLLNEFYTRAGQSRTHGLIVVVCIAAFGYVNVDRLRIMQSSYPDVQAIIPLASHIQSHNTVLSEDPYLFRYVLMDSVSQAQIRETTWLDNNNDGKYEQRDVQQAVWDRKFDYVFLNDQQHKTLNIKLRKMLMLRDYDLVFEEKYQLRTMSGERRHGVISLHRQERDINGSTKNQHAIHTSM